MPIEDWPSTVEEALAVQDRLRGRVEPADDSPELPPTVTSLDEFSMCVGLREPAARARAGCHERPGLLAPHPSSRVPIALSRVFDELVAAGRRPSHPRCSGALTGRRPASGCTAPRVGESRAEPGAHRSRMRSENPEESEPGYPSEGRPSALASRYRLLEVALRASPAALR
ncbi:hypothetical protein [Amycolatopsis sp. NPDC004169]|uniref:hypothetical protein n=1 Tax=Amycolatopsis sp. NPDC004169 TaxID=3154453 RepID=UPI0033AE7FC1